jgi:hypothetical protein
VHGRRADHRLSRHADRQALAKDFGATDIVEERGDDTIQAVIALTGGIGADATLEWEAPCQARWTDPGRGLAPLAGRPSGPTMKVNRSTHGSNSEPAGGDRRSKPANHRFTRPRADR